MNPHRAMFCSAPAQGSGRLTVLSLQLQLTGVLVLHVRQVPMQTLLPNALVQHMYNTVVCISWICQLGHVAEVLFLTLWIFRGGFVGVYFALVRKVRLCVLRRKQG